VELEKEKLSANGIGREEGSRVPTKEVYWKTP
jgi:hypothetical protein